MVPRVRTAFSLRGVRGLALVLHGPDPHCTYGMMSEKCWFEFVEDMAQEPSTKSRILSRPRGCRGQEEGLERE